MASLLLTCSEDVLRSALAGAEQTNQTLDNYIAQLITEASSSESELASEEDFDPDSLALRIYEKSSHLAKAGDELTVEHLHHHLFADTWRSRTTGQRIAIGRAFKKLVDKKLPVEISVRVKVPAYVAFVRKDQQNRAIYRIEEF